MHMYYGWIWILFALMWWGPFRARRRFRHQRDLSRAEQESREGYQRTLEQQQGWIEALETRLHEMEQRLDFTEGLLARRGEKEGLPSPRSV